MELQQNYNHYCILYIYWRYRKSHPGPLIAEISGIFCPCIMIITSLCMKKNEEYQISNNFYSFKYMQLLEGAISFTMSSWNHKDKELDTGISTLRRPHRHISSIRKYIIKNSLRRFY